MSKCAHCGFEMATRTHNCCDSAEAKIRQEQTCNRQLQEKCDDLRAEKMELEAKVKGYEDWLIGWYDAGFSKKMTRAQIREELSRRMNGERT